MTGAKDPFAAQARTLSFVGCGCEDADEAELSCSHFRDGLCNRTADYIAEALKEEIRACAQVAKDHDDGTAREGPLTANTIQRAILARLTRHP